MQEFKERHPTAKTLEKNAPKPDEKLTLGATVTPAKRSSPPLDVSKFIVTEEPGTKIAEVGILNGRFPVGVKVAELPSLVVSDAGPYIKNSTGHMVF